MPVYVDNPKNRFGRMRMCHMIADSKNELLDMVEKIGVQKKWIQKENTSYEHFDICLAKRKLAVKYGAIEIDSKELLRIIKSKE